MQSVKIFDQFLISSYVVHRSVADKVSLAGKHNFYYHDTT